MCLFVYAVLVFASSCSVVNVIYWLLIDFTHFLFRTCVLCCCCYFIFSSFCRRGNGWRTQGRRSAICLGTALISSQASRQKWHARNKQWYLNFIGHCCCYSSNLVENSAKRIRPLSDTWLLNWHGIMSLSTRFDEPRRWFFCRGYIYFCNGFIQLFNIMYV